MYGRSRPGLIRSRRDRARLVKIVSSPRFLFAFISFTTLSLAACGSGSPSGGASGGAPGAGGGAPGGGSGPIGSGGTNGPESGGTSSGTGGADGSSGGTEAGGSAPGTGGIPGAGGSAEGSGGSGDPGSFPSAPDLVKSFKLGWNLGNSLDAPESETAWGNPTITPALLQAVKAAGFGAVRIPVTWSLHMGPGPNFTIEPAFLARVAEVVGYAKAAGLPAIINIHHDGADGMAGVEWLTLNDSQGGVTEQNSNAVRERFVAVWKQVADYFKDHDAGLIFESMNEIHDGYDAPDPRYYDIITDLNQVFVDLVRSSGGNNAKRCLVVPGYNTNIDYTLAGFEKPSDPTSDRLILSVHFYDPWPYAGEGNTHTWGSASPGSDSWGQESHVVSQYDKLKAAYVDKGLPMIVGEYGAVHQEGYENYRRYYMEYVTKAVIDRGMVPFYWDNGGKNSGPDGFALFDRKDASVVQPTILAAMIKAVTEDYSLGEIPLP